MHDELFNINSRRKKMIREIDNSKKLAFKFILLMGMVSLFGDIVYEGARSISGPYLAVLGASAGIVGLFSGLGEFLGYGLRLIFGYLADRTKSYWFFTVIGYGLLVSIPLLAFTRNWQLAVFLLVLERIGKAIRSPSRDAILSHSTKQIGRGWGFGIHEALDQIGAFIGPLIFSLVFLFRGSYREGFSILWIPTFLTLTILTIARSKVPLPEQLEISDQKAINNTDNTKKLPRIFWLYTLFTFFSVVGFAHFPLIAYHFKMQSVVSDVQIPIFYALAMGVDALLALFIGKTYDRIGLIILIIIPIITIPLPLFIFSKGYYLALIGVLLWGAVLGIHETIMRAAIAEITSINQRGFAYGLFNTVYGIAGFLGSLLVGILYDISTVYIVLFVFLVEIASIQLFFFLKKEMK